MSVPVFERAFGITREAASQMYNETANQAWNELQARMQNEPIPTDSVINIDLMAGQEWMDARHAELVAERMAASRP